MYYIKIYIIKIIEYLICILHFSLHFLLLLFFFFLILSCLCLAAKILREGCVFLAVWHGALWKLMAAMRNEYSEKQHLHGYRIYYQWYPSWSASLRTQDVVSQALEMNALSLWEGPDSASSQSWKQNEGNLQGCTSIPCHDLTCTDFTPQWSLRPYQYFTNLFELFHIVKSIYNNSYHLETAEFVSCFQWLFLASDIETLIIDILNLLDSNRYRGTGLFAAKWKSLPSSLQQSSIWQCCYLTLTQIKNPSVIIRNNFLWET